MTHIGGSFAVPDNPLGVVVLAVRSPSERREEVRLQLADFLHHVGFASLVAALENDDDHGTLGLELLAGRVADAVGWVGSRTEVDSLPLGVLAMDEAAAPALVAAAHLTDRLAALVVSGGRPDRAGAALALVESPTLLVAGARAGANLDGSRAALRDLPVTAELAVIEDSAEPNRDPEAVGTLAWLCQRWFLDHLTRPIS